MRCLGCSRARGAATHRASAATAADRNTNVWHLRLRWSLQKLPTVNIILCILAFACMREWSNICNSSWPREASPSWLCNASKMAKLRSKAPHRICATAKFSCCGAIIPLLFDGRNRGSPLATPATCGTSTHSPSSVTELRSSVGVMEVFKCFMSIGYVDDLNAPLSMDARLRNAVKLCTALPLNTSCNVPGDWSTVMCECAE